MGEGSNKVCHSGYLEPMPSRGGAEQEGKHGSKCWGLSKGFRQNLRSDGINPF